MKSRSFIFIITIFSSLYAFGDGNKKGKEFALEMNSSEVSTFGNSTKDIPHFDQNKVDQQISNPQHYNSGLTIEDEARSETNGSELYNYFNTVRKNRKDVVLDPAKDPIFSNHQEVREKASSLTDNYEGCVDLPFNDDARTTYEDKVCYVKRTKKSSSSYQCDRTLSVQCTNYNAGQLDPVKENEIRISGSVIDLNKEEEIGIFTLGKNEVYRHAKCDYFRTYLEIDIPKPDLINRFTILDLKYDDWLDVSVNDQLVFRGIGDAQGTHLSGEFTCEQMETWEAKNVNLKPYLKPGKNTIEFVNLVAGGGLFFAQLQILRMHDCSEREYTTLDCAGNENKGGKLISRRCVDRSRSENAGYYEIFRYCWKWKETYQLRDDKEYTNDSDCDQYIAEGCKFKSEECQMNGTNCSTKEVTYSCPSYQATKNLSLCASQLTCPDGDCTNDVGREYKPATDDFKDAAVGMAVAGEIAKEFDKDNLSVFKGTSLGCGKSVMGFSNCCKDSGWGSDMGLTRCNQEEHELGLLKQAKKTHYVGRYCSKKQELPFGGSVCLVRKKVYCTYPSKLARILIEQGNNQLGRGYGAPKNPNCKGFTLEEIGRINFDKMDLSEFYEDVIRDANNAKKPNSDSLSNDIRDKIKRKMNSMGQ